MLLQRSRPAPPAVALAKKRLGKNVQPRVKHSPASLVVAAAVAAALCGAPQARGGYGTEFTFDLNPTNLSGFGSTNASGISGSQQVGDGHKTTGPGNLP